MANLTINAQNSGFVAPKGPQTITNVSPRDITGLKLVEIPHQWCNTVIKVSIKVLGPNSSSKIVLTILHVASCSRWDLWPFQLHPP